MLTPVMEAPMIVRCPECAHVRSVSEDFIPAKAEFATCPRCGSRFRFRTVAKDPLPKIASAPFPQEQLPAPAPKIAQSGGGDIWDAVNSLNDQWQDVPEGAPANGAALQPAAPQLATPNAALPSPLESFSPPPSSPVPAPALQKTAVTQKKERKGLFSFLKRIEKNNPPVAKENAAPPAQSSPLHKAHAEALAAQAAYDHSQEFRSAEPQPAWEQALEAQPLPTQQQGTPPAPTQDDLLHPFPAEQHAPPQAQPMPQAPKPTVQKTQPAPPQAASAPHAVAEPQPAQQSSDTSGEPNRAPANTSATSAPKQQRIRVRPVIVASAQPPAKTPEPATQPVASTPLPPGKAPATSRPAPPPGSPAAKLLEKARALQEAELQERAALAAQEQQALNTALQAEMEEQNALPPSANIVAEGAEVSTGVPDQPGTDPKSTAPKGAASTAPVPSQMPPWAEQVPTKVPAGPDLVEKAPSAMDNYDQNTSDVPALLPNEALPEQDLHNTDGPLESPTGEHAPAGALPRIRVRPVRKEYTGPDTPEKQGPSECLAQADSTSKEPSPSGRFLGTLYPEREDRLVEHDPKVTAHDINTGKPGRVHFGAKASAQAYPPKEVELRPDSHDETVPGSIEEKVAGDLLLMLAPTQRPVRNLGTLDDFSAKDRDDDPTLLQGIPWENLRQVGWIRGFFATIHMVMFNSAFFYSHIKERGSLTPSYLFMLLLGYIALLCSSLWVQALNAFMGEATTPLLTPAFALPTLLLLTPVCLGALQIVTATLIQSILRLSTSDKGQFPLIFKMLGYAFAPLVLSVIPFVGPIAGGVWFFFSLVTGCRVALGLSWGQLAPALLLPLALVGGCVALLFM